jgi:hypothetical protein
MVFANSQHPLIRIIELPSAKHLNQISSAFSHGFSCYRCVEVINFNRARASSTEFNRLIKLIKSLSCCGDRPGKICTLAQVQKRFLQFAKRKGLRPISEKSLQPSLALEFGRERWHHRHQSKPLLGWTHGWTDGWMDVTPRTSLIKSELLLRLICGPTRSLARGRPADRPRLLSSLTALLPPRCPSLSPLL